MTVVLISVFVPLAFFCRLHRQHLPPVRRDGGQHRFSAFMALSLTPALCATLFKPVEAGHHHERAAFWLVQSQFRAPPSGYEGPVARLRAARPS